MDNEEWRPVVGFEGWYEVSDHGRVRRVMASTGTRVGKVMRNQRCSNGYEFVRLSRQRAVRAYLVHRLVMAAFAGPCPPLHEVNHIDGVKTHNRRTNLEYVTKSQNARHAFYSIMHTKLPTVASRKGESHSQARLRDEDVYEIRRLVDESKGAGQAAIASKFGISASMVSNIYRGKAWKHLRPVASPPDGDVFS